MNTERIYIGGLSPAKGLTVSLVASRLMKVPNIEIVSINDQPIAHALDGSRNLGKSGNNKYSTIDEDGCYVDLRQFFFLEARYSCTTTSDTTSPKQQHSALETLAKQYNNTKWKGCNLRVESARPHFLKRLEAERFDRAVREKRDEQMLMAPTATAHPNEPHSSKPRRRLRIRKRFAEEAYAVDTHPRTISVSPNFLGWDSFASLHKRMQDKLSNHRIKLAQWRREERKNWTVNKSENEKQSASGGDLKNMIFLNRGLHVRFDGNSDSNVTASNCSERSDESTSLMISQEKKKEVYAWSDDDTTKSGSNNENESKDDTATAVKNISGYVWSDEDDSLDENAAKKHRTSSLKMTNALDEFSGGVDFDDLRFDNNSILEGDDCMVSSQHTDDLDVHVELEDDIRSNLDILSKLFPSESINNTPKSVADSVYQLEPNGTSKMKSDCAFGAGLIVQRYDPTKDDGGADFLHSRMQRDGKENVHEKMEKQEAKTDMFNSESFVNQSGSKDDEESEGINTLEGKLDEQEKPGDKIYEQDKLENIFKQAREKQKQNDGFSFGALFESQIDGAATEQNRNGFSLAGMFESQIGDTANKALNDTEYVLDNSQHGNSDKRAPSKSQRKTRVGLCFPHSILDDYESQFFSINGGSRVIADLESMRNDQGVNEMWQKKRDALTLDWKRKQKKAVSRKVKKARRY